MDIAYLHAVMASLMLALNNTRDAIVEGNFTEEQQIKAMAELKAMSELLNPLMDALGLND